MFKFVFCMFLASVALGCVLHFYPGRTIQVNESIVTKTKQVARGFVRAYKEGERLDQDH